MLIMQTACWEQSLSPLSFFSTVALLFLSFTSCREGMGQGRVEVARVGAVQYWVMTSLGQGSGKGGGENIKTVLKV